MSVVALYSKIVEDTVMWQSSHHGTTHWMRVRDNAVYLAEREGGEAQIAEYFSVLHDCMRENEGHDPEHGPRAAVYAREHRNLIDLTNRQFLLLQKACAGHTCDARARRYRPDAGFVGTGIDLIWEEWVSSLSPNICLLIVRRGLRHN